MNRRAALAVAAALAVHGESTTEVLRKSQNPSQLLAAAQAIIRSRNEAAIRQLQTYLVDPAFLARLDPAQDGANLAKVFVTARQYPSRGVEVLCIALASAPEYETNADRLLEVLETLAASRPMTAASVEVFRRTNGQAFYSTNGRLLIENGSPRAMNLLGEMLTSADKDLERRTELAHELLPPHRTELPVLELVNTLLDQRIEESTANVLIESIFDYQPGAWYGKRRDRPKPAAWDTAPAKSKVSAAALARKALGRPTLPPSLRDVLKSHAAAR